MHEKDDEEFMGNATQFAVVGDAGDAIQIVIETTVNGVIFILEDEENQTEIE